ncbi:MAG TPA: glycosyltransferase family protein [Longimicrobiales bacterium]|nr:glycosyltransferase family protein [Longimicrobiales bacterium]
MARVLYGVHGTGRGHAIRALTVARRYPAHDFLFVSHAEGARLLRGRFAVLDCPNPITQVSAHRVDILPTLWRTAATLRQGSRWMGEVRRAAETFKPDVAITDYEFFVPRVARELGLPCLSLDNQHAITKLRPSFPPSAFPNWLGTAIPIELLFSAADQYLVACFFEAPLRHDHPRVRWAPSLIRDEVIALRAEQGDHVVAYQGHPTSRRFIEALGSLGRPVHLYGQGSTPAGSVRMMGFREDAFLADLATCAYVVCGGGHTLISEALCLGKPVLALPVAGMFEQFLNAHYLQRNGLGDHALMAVFSASTLRDFESRLDRFRHRVRQRDFVGNAAVFASLDDFIAGRWREPSARRLARGT